MSMRRTIIVLFIGILLVLGGYVVYQQTQQNNETPTESVDVDSEEALELTESYTTQLSNGSLSFQYPAEWVVGGEFPELSIIITTEADYVSGLGSVTVMEPGQVYMQVQFAPESLAVMADTTPEAVLEALIQTVEGEAEGTVSEIATKTLNDKPAAFVLLDSEDGAQGITMVIDSGDAYSTFTASFAPNEREMFLATVEAIAGSITYVVDTTEATAETTEAEMTAEATAASD